MRVFHREHAGRPLRVVWMLEELGEPYEMSVMTREEGRAEEHLARHPLGSVFESAAICLHLADLRPEAGLIPPPGTHARALAYQWTVFAPAELEPPLIESAVQATRDPERSQAARLRFDRAVGAVSDALGSSEYLLDGGFTVADVLVGSALGFTARVGFADELPSSVRGYLARLQERPAYQRAYARTSG
jgi:glutathione S-transferase